MRLTLAPIDIITSVGILLLSLLTGLYLARRAHAGQNSVNFFLGGRHMRWYIVGASYFATNIGAEHLVGLSGDAYRYGLCASTVELATAISLGLAVGLLFPYYFKNKVFTIPEFLEIRYNVAARTFFAIIMLVICIMTKMAFCLYAGALVLHSLLGFDIMTTVAILALITAIFTMLGGFTAIAYTDTIQTAIMILGCGTMLFLGLHRVGGWSSLVAHVPAAVRIAMPYNHPSYPFWGIILGAAYSGTFYWGVDQVNVQRALGAANLQQARWGAMFAVLLKLTPVFIFALPGVIAFALFPGRDPKLTFVTLLNELLPVGLRGVVLAALLAALTNSLNGSLNAVSTMCVRDLVLRFWPKTTEKSQVRLGRLAIIAAAILGMGAAYLVYKTPDGLYKYLQTISIYMIMPLFPAIIFGIMSKRVTMAGAVASVAVGIALAAVFVTDQIVGVQTGGQWFPWLHTTFTLNYTYRGFLGTLIVSAVLFAVSMFTEKTPAHKLATTTMDWGKKIERFQGWLDWRLHLAALLGVTAGLYAWLW